MLTACPECGTQVVAGSDCPLCGTPTPAPAPEPGDTPPSPDPAASGDEPVAPVRGAAPPPDPNTSRAMSTGERYANQWEVIYEKIRRAVAPKYEVTGILGFGGMAGVYLADEPRLGRKVAIKVMSPGLMVDPQLVERFSQEARTIAQFNHPHIVTIYEVDERDGLHYFTMTYVPGRTLGQVMAGTEGPLPISVVRAWLYQIGDALAYAHHHGVIHRDVKPGNVLLDQRGNALVTDFGIAKVTDEPGLTRTGMLVGTPAYMSPEQCSSGKVAGASDQYSLGAVAYQMITGQPPFSGPTLAVLQAHVGQDPRPIRELRSDCPDDLVGAVQRMLEKKPEDRWPSLSAAIAGAGATSPGFDGPIREQLELLAAQAATIRVEPWFDVVREGSTESLKATVLDARGRTLENRKVEWRSGDDLIGSVTQGRLRAISPGTTTLDAVSGGATTTLSLTVEADPVPSIEVEPAQATVAAGSSIPLDAVVVDWDGSRMEDRAILWSSSNDTIARVSQDGVVEGVRPGEAIITAGTGGKSAAAVVTVVAAGAIAAGRSSEPAPEATLRPKGRTPPPREATPAPTPVATAPHEATTGDTTIVTSSPGSKWKREKKGEESKRPDDGGRPKWLVPGAIAAVAILAIVAFIILKPGGGAAATGTVSIGGTLPPGATITAVASDNSRTAVEGGSVSLAPGRYTFEFSAPGYDPYSEAVQVEAGGTVPWLPVVIETAADTPTGTIALGDGLPADALVTATLPDGSSRTITGPTRLEPGEYTVALSADGYEDVTQPVTVAADQTVVFAPTLTRAAPPPPTVGTLRITGNLPPGSTIRLRPPGGQSRVITDRTLSLDPGRYSLEFSASGYQDDSGTVQIVAGASRTWTPSVREVAPAQPPQPPPPTTGTLRIDRSGLPAGARITLRSPDGSTRDVTASSLELPPGSYTLEFRADGYRNYTSGVTVSAGGSTPWSPTVEEVPAPPPVTGPTRDPAADRAAVESAVRDFAAAFNRREAATVVPLLPESARGGWRTLLTSEDILNFRAELASTEPVSVNGDAATVLFSIRVTYDIRGGARGQSSVTSYVGSASRGPNGWQLVSLAPG